MSPPENAPLTTERIPTGIPGLDEVLGGGLLRSGIYMVMGEPGAGKTMLANQLCYHQAARGSRSLYVTLLAETHSRMLEHLKPMRFFEPRAMPDSVYYVSAFRTLEDHGLPGLLELLRREVRHHDTGLLVIDGLVQAQESASSPREFKKFIHELQVSASLSRFTVLLLSSGTGGPVQPEHTMVDGILELRERSYGVRAHRELRVRKFRGGENLAGQHFFRISDAGLEVFPRLESLTHREQPLDKGAERVHFGIPSLDALLPGGLAMGSTTLLLGPSGSGKTMLGMNLLAEGVRLGEPCLHFGFYETPDRLLNKLAKVGLDGLQEAANSKRLAIHWQPPGEYVLDVLASRLLAMVRAHRARRVFVDGLSGFFDAAVEPARLSLFFSALTHALRCLGATTAFSLETPQIFGPELTFPMGAGISAVTENLLFLRHVELDSRLRRLVSILKLRDTEYDPTLREFTISRDGITVLGPFMSGDAMLTGLARHPSASTRGD
jgi:circadian clock protein KaiC